MAPLTLTSEYRIPKREVSAEVTLLGHPRKVVKLFLHERAETHTGPERPSDLLNGPGEFFPVIEPSGKLVLLHRDAVMVISVAAESEFHAAHSGEEQPDPEGAKRITVEITLQDGSSIRGLVRFVMPEGRTRLIDYMNTQEHFLTVREESLARLVNKRRIVRIAVIEPQSGPRAPWPSSTD
jgi:hypothetical protein